MLHSTKNFIRRKIHNSQRNRIRNMDFSIISNNCWGGKIYQIFDLPYATPFVGLFVHAPCYLKLLKDLRGYLASPLTFTNRSRYKEVNEKVNSGEIKRYPIGLLKGDVEIHFLHYSSEEEAYDKWNRRLERLNWDNIFIKLSERDLCTEEHLIEFEKLPFNHKVSFTVKYYSHLKSSVWFARQTNFPQIEDELVYYKRYFDVVDWLNGGTGVIRKVPALLQMYIQRQSSTREFIVSFIFRLFCLMTTKSRN